MSWQLEGVDELKNTLRELGVEVSTKVCATAARESAKVVRDALVEDAPRGTEPTRKTRRRKGGSVEEYDYGRLRDNITIRKIRAEATDQVRFAIGIGAAFWGLILEFGSVRMPARPWLRPAFDRVAPAVVADMAANLKLGIDRQVKRLRRLRAKGRR